MYCFFNFIILELSLFYNIPSIIVEEQGITYDLLPQLSEEDMKVLCPKIGDRGEERHSSTKGFEEFFFLNSQIMKFKEVKIRSTNRELGRGVELPSI